MKKQVREKQNTRGILTVDVVVVDIGYGWGNILLIRRGKNPFKGKLALPGGHVEASDLTLRHAAQRELREETGLDLPIENFGLFTVLDTPSRDPRGQKFSVVFIACVDKLALRVRNGCRAGDDASKIEYKRILSIDSDAMAFDHALVIQELRKNHQEEMEYDR